MLDTVKTALRITNTAFDAELLNLISAAQLDMGIAGVVIPATLDALVTVAIVTYCKLHFLSYEYADYVRLKESYDEQKAQLSMATGYTDWGEIS